MPINVIEAARPPTGPAPTPADTMSDAADTEAFPRSFGVFKPVGHVMIGLPTQAQADELVVALHGAGWPRPYLLHFSPEQSVRELSAMVDHAGTMAGFGYEITLLRRYLVLAQQGCRWLLVRVDDADHAARAAELARACGAVMAVHYRTLTVEELIA